MVSEETKKTVEQRMTELENNFEELKTNLYEVLQGILQGIERCNKEKKDTTDYVNDVEDTKMVVEHSTVEA